MSITQPMSDVPASTSHESQSKPSITVLAEGLISNNMRNLFIENLESIYDVWVGMLQKSTLPSSMASNDPRISLVLQDLAEESENTDVALSRLASVQLVRLMNSLQSRIKSDRRSGRVVFGKRADSIAMDMFVSALGSAQGRTVARRQAFWRRRIHKRRASLARNAPLLIITHTAKAERIM
ncbi:hypothetical protein DER44DRAFT_802573 [Fusarium oxysporum]|nr:hypothetical protein DER44DRAFT_802573 [Fusarium oxysporum]